MSYKTEQMREYMKAYRKKAVETGKAVNSDLSYHKNLRLRVFELLGGAICINCGCNEVSILEINHINGGGHAEARQTPHHNRKVMRDISTGRRGRDEFNVLCRPCNAQHYVEIILGIKGHKIIWSNN